MNTQYKDDLSGERRDLTVSSCSIGETATPQILLPAGMTPSEARHWLLAHLRHEEQLVGIREAIKGFPYDAAHALYKAISQVFGHCSIDDPQIHKLPIDAHGHTVEIQIGTMTFPGIEDGYIETNPDFPNGQLWITGAVKRKHAEKISVLCDTTREILKSESLYRGKALSLRLDTDPWTQRRFVGAPRFLGVANAQRPILNHPTEALLQASVYNLIERTDLMRKLSRRLKRGLLLSGSFGTGKSLTAQYLARLCEEHGWTFAYVEDVEQLGEIYQFARAFQPSLVFAEDVDRIEEPVVLSSILDGVTSKDSDVVLVLTTNWIDRIPQALLRPGRLDAVVFYEPPDAQSAAELIRLYGNRTLADDFDFARAGKALIGQIPAVIQEVVQRSISYAVSHSPEANKPSDLKITATDVEATITGMLPHLDYLNRPKAVEPNAMRELGDALGGHIASVVASYTTAAHHQFNGTLADLIGTASNGKPTDAGNHRMDPR